MSRPINYEKRDESIRDLESAAKKLFEKGVEIKSSSKSIMLG